MKTFKALFMSAVVLALVTPVLFPTFTEIIILITSKFVLGKPRPG